MDISHAVRGFSSVAAALVVVVVVVGNFFSPFMPFETLCRTSVDDGALSGEGLKSSQRVERSDR